MPPALIAPASVNLVYLIKSFILSSDNFLAANFGFILVLNNISSAYIFPIPATKDWSNKISLIGLFLFDKYSNIRITLKLKVSQDYF